MALFKSPNPESAAISMHGREFDIVNGFVEIADDEMTPEIEATLKFVGFSVATPEDVDAVLAAAASASGQKQEADERSKLLGIMKAWGFKIDARKNLAFVRERYDDLVKEGQIKPDQAPPVDAPEPKDPPAGA